MMNTPDLAGAGCRTLDIDFMPDLSAEEATSLFGKKFSPSPDWGYVGYQEYSAETGKYYCYLYVHHRKKHPAKEKALLHAHLTFGIGKWSMMAGIRNKAFDPAFDFLNSHPALLEGTSVNVRGNFDYKTARYESSIKLPLAYPIAGFEKSDIIGLRLSVKEKASEERPQFTMIVERLPNGDIHHSVTFRYKVTDVEKFLPTVLALSSAMSQKFIVPKTTKQS